MITQENIWSAYVKYNIGDTIKVNIYCHGERPRRIKGVIIDKTPDFAVIQLRNYREAVKWIEIITQARREAQAYDNRGIIEGKHRAPYNRRKR